MIIKIAVDEITLPISLINSLISEGIRFSVMDSSVRLPTLCDRFPADFEPPIEYSDKSKL